MRLLLISLAIGIAGCSTLPEVEAPVQPFLSIELIDTSEPAVRPAPVPTIGAPLYVVPVENAASECRLAQCYMVTEQRHENAAFGAYDGDTLRTIRTLNALSQENFNLANTHADRVDNLEELINTYIRMGRMSDAQAAFSFAWSEYYRGRMREEQLKGLLLLLIQGVTAVQ